MMTTNSDLETQCNNGIDDDADGLIDTVDEICTSASKDAEIGDCEDGLDNDGDGWVDLDDPDCENENADGITEALGGYTGTQCNDGADNDGDAKVDALDPNCDDADDVLEAATCDDNQDNDLDGWVDLDDQDVRHLLHHQKSIHQQMNVQMILTTTKMVS